uniref:Uncharacterized protein n=1 Tax=Cacopsylla melanoneura TaxID=428564 RepID=A0A8D9F636_9HEMI
MIRIPLKVKIKLGDLLRRCIVGQLHNLCRTHELNKVNALSVASAYLVVNTVETTAWKSNLSATCGFSTAGSQYCGDCCLEKRSISCHLMDSLKRTSQQFLKIILPCIR